MYERVAVAKSLSPGKPAETAHISRSEYQAQQQESAPAQVFNPLRSSWNFANLAIHAPAERNQPSSGKDGRPGAARHVGLPPLPIQAKLEVVAVDDPLEREADRVAEQVMRAPAASPVEVAGRAPFHPQAHGLEPKTAWHVGEALRSLARPLDPATRAFMEPRFGEDFSRVRIHSNSLAERSAQELNARAYTVGQDVVLGADGHNRETMAHELTHVLQQRVNRAANPAGALSSLLSSAPLGIYCAPKDAPPNPKVRDENESLETIFIDITEDYNDILSQQRDGVDRVEKAASHIQPPKEEHSFWAVAAELALTAACFAVGKIVEEYAVKKLEHLKVEETAAAVVGEGLKVFTAEGLKEKVKIEAKAISSEDGRDIFFDAQKEALNQQTHEGKRQFNHEGKRKILSSKDPLTQARVLRDAMDEAYSHAKDETKNLEIDRWATTLAQSELGTRYSPVQHRGGSYTERATDLTPVLSAHGVGTTIEEEYFGKTEEKGVLTIKVEAATPEKPLKVKSMEIHGLSPESVNLLNGRKIKDVTLPVVVLTRDLPRLLEETEGGVLKIGRDENGSVSLGSHLSVNTKYYLLLRAFYVGYTNHKPSLTRADFPELDVLRGAEAIFEKDLAETAVNLKRGD
jgi:Domain of unknown function (DUF4157)